MEESKIVGFIILLIGGLNVTRPDLMISFQMWTQRVIMGAKYEPSKRTYMIVRIIGVVFVIIGYLAIAGLI